jgi:hypothetical protein
MKKMPVFCNFPSKQIPSDFAHAINRLKASCFLSFSSCHVRAQISRLPSSRMGSRCRGSGSSGRCPRTVCPAQSKEVSHIFDTFKTLLQMFAEIFVSCYLPYFFFRQVFFGSGSLYALTCISKKRCIV